MKKIFGVYIALIFVAIACTKETSYESGANVFGNSVGTLKDSLGNCKSIVVAGKYYADTTLTDSNFVLVQINVTTPGNYNIYTDTSNGFWFRDTGYITAGQHTIKLKGFGKPLLPLNTDFIAYYGNSFCTFTVSIANAIVAPVISDYFPTTIGSNWGYTAAIDTLHMEATNRDTTINSVIYRLFTETVASVPTKTYYRKSNGDYYRYYSLDNVSAAMEVLFLKDYLPVTSQWDSPVANTTYLGTNTQVKMHYTILGKNLSVSLNGNQIDTVIKMQNDLQVKIAGTTFTTINTQYTYFAKNIGLVQYDEPGIFSRTIRRWQVY